MQDDKIRSVDALPDNRPIAEKNKDYSTQEIASATAIVPFQNKKLTKVTATEFNQWYVGSCVPHGFLTMLEYEGISTPDISRLRAYRKRSNYPQAGSNGVDMFLKIQAGQSSDFPTPEKFREADATKMPYVEGWKNMKEFSFFQYIDKSTGRYLPQNVPADIANGKAVAIFFWATEDEWEKEYVEATDNSVTLSNAEVRHCVCVVPYGDFTENGKRWLTIQDSAKFGKRGIRYVEFDTFFMNRTYFLATAYPKGAIPTPPVPPSLPKPTIACALGDKNGAVLNLQNFLIDEGKLSSEYATGYYGALTAKAVLWWQLEHWNQFTNTVPELLKFAGNYWGQQSIDIISK